MSDTLILIVNRIITIPWQKKNTFANKYINTIVAPRARGEAIAAEKIELKDQNGRYRLSW